MTRQRDFLTDLTRISFLTAIAVSVQASSAMADEPASRKAALDDLKKLQGTWVCVAMERDGEEQSAEDFKGSTAVYADDRVTLYREGEFFRSGIITLDPSKSPKRVNTWDLGGPYTDQTVPGIYDVEGDTLKLCFSHPGEERPVEFTTKKKPGFLYCVYKRKKP